MRPVGTARQLERRRQRAIALLEDGRPPVDVARLVGVDRRSVTSEEEGVRFRRRGDALTRTDLAVSGSDLESLGAKGPRIGQMLAELLDQVLEDPALNTKDRLLDLARKMK